MALLQKKWVLAMLVLILIVGYNSVSTWFEQQRSIPLGLTAEEPEKPEEAPVVEAASDADAPETVLVHICGAVVNPGVFQLPAGSRVNDALVLAGGYTADADRVSVNLAEPVEDGQQIIIYQQEEAVKLTAPKPAGSGGKTAAAGGGSLPVSINSGSMEALMLLNGIGEKTAQKIIDYRQSQGGFKTIEEIKNVPGIGDKKFEQIKNDIRL